MKNEANKLEKRLKMEADGNVKGQHYKSLTQESKKKKRNDKKFELL